MRWGLPAGSARAKAGSDARKEGGHALLKARPRRRLSRCDGSGHEDGRRQHSGVLASVAIAVVGGGADSGGGCAEAAAGCSRNSAFNFRCTCRHLQTVWPIASRAADSLADN